MPVRSGRTLVVGEALIDIVVRNRDAQEHVGGSPANVATGLARLGHPTELLTHLARDDRGQRISEHLRRAGVRLAAGSDRADRTPTARAHLDPAGAATYDFDLPWDIPLVDGSGTAHVHTGSIAAILEPGGSRVLELVQAARAEATVSYDPNLRPTIMGEPHGIRSRVEELVGLADVVKASDEDIDWLYAGAPVREVADLWGRLGPSVVVVTRGADGALLVVPATGEQTVVPATTARVVDTVGAGDSFMAGLVSGLLDAGLLGADLPTGQNDVPGDPGGAPGDPGGAPGDPGGAPGDPVGAPGDPVGVPGDLRARRALRQSRMDGILPAVHRALDCARWTIERAGAAAPTRSDLTAS